jgi:transcriptional regulator with XRE-family HTH domain
MPTKPHKQNEVLKAFGATVRSLRKHLNMSQYDLAERASLHDTYIGDIEQSGRNIGLLNLLKLSIALKTPPDKFMQKLLQQIKRANKDFDLEEFFRNQEPVERREPRKRQRK